MKKILMLPLFAMAALVSQVLAAPCQKNGQNAFCDWGDSCWGIDDQYGSVATANADKGIVACAAGSCSCDNLLKNCDANGTMYAGTSEANTGAGKQCNGTVIGGTDPNAVLGYCKWNGNVDDCGPVTDAETWGYCESGWRYTSQAACKGGSNNNTQSSASNNNNNNNNNNNTQSSASNNNNNNNNNTPIISYSSAPIAGLNVAYFGRSLQIASGKDATVFLFDIRGKQMFSQRVLSGTTTIGLGNQRQGVYYAVVKSGSQKQTMKVILK